ncbi:MAG: hypothetical protein ABI718_02235 [Acidobacteriota bacterium]
MEPASFHLTIGMAQSQVTAKLAEQGWSLHKGKIENEHFIEYDQGKTVTLVFSQDKLSSARFEFVDFVPEVKAAFAEQRKSLRHNYGLPLVRGNGNTLIYDLPDVSIFAVLSTNPKDEFGKKGLGFFVVRYFVSPPLPAE